MPSSARHADRRMEDEQIGDEVVVFDHLAVLGIGTQSRARPRKPGPADGEISGV
jgi:hypothetical protein